MGLCKSSLFKALERLGAVCSCASFHCSPVQVYPSKSINTRAIPNQTPTPTKREDLTQKAPEPMAGRLFEEHTYSHHLLPNALESGQHCICRKSHAIPFCPSPAGAAKMRNTNISAHSRGNGHPKALRVL